MREDFLLHKVEELVRVCLILLREGLCGLCSILEFNEHELFVSCEHRARLVPIIVCVKILLFHVLNHIVHEDWGLRHDTGGGLGCWKVSCITKGEYVLVFVMLEGNLVHIYVTVGSGYRLKEIWGILRRNDVQEVIVHNDIGIPVLGVSEVGLAIILINLVQIMEEVRGDSLLLSDLI